MPSATVPSRLVPLILRATRANRHNVTRERAQANLTRLVENPRVIGPPRNLPKTVRVTQEEQHGWPVFRVRLATGASSRTTLYFHGGAYLDTIHAWHWKLIAALVAETGVEMLVPMYPLVPEGGTAVEVADTAVRIARDAGEGTLLLGDSAGAQIAFATSAGLRGCGITPPLTVLISPPVDLELVNPRLPEVAHLDPWLCRDGLLLVAERWVGDHGFGHEINPINTDPTGLGPMLIFSAPLDILNLDIPEWVARLRLHGVDVEHHEGQGQVHDYVILPTKEAVRARRRIIERIKDVTDDRNRETSPGER